MADKYTVRKQEDGKWKVIDRANGRAVESNLTSGQALARCKRLNDRGK